MRYRFVLCAAFLVAVAAHADDARRLVVTTPKEHFGFNIGDDYCLMNYRQLKAYWEKLDAQSDRLKVTTIGVTEEGRPQIMAVVTSPANHARLAYYRDVSRRLARVEGVDEAAARRFASDGKAVVWIDGGLHANETLCAQAMTETIYQLLSGDDAETKRILDDVIILFVHANPDGQDLVNDWYMREADPKKRSLAGVPRLYQKYAGHDNNRDFYAANLAETRNMNRVMYREWLPQIVYNHHQPGPPGTVLFVPPFRDPFNYHIDPLVVSGIDAVGAAMMQRFLGEGKPGATSRSGARYSTWWNGGLRSACYFHNMIGLLSETIGSPTPMQIPFNPSLQLPRGDYLEPIPPQRWHFRESVDYSVTANKAVLDYASRHREQLLFNIWRMGASAVECGGRDHWTTTPKVVEQAKTARGANNRPSPTDFPTYFRDPARRDPRGYVIPADQPDFLTATKFVNALIDCGVVVHRTTGEFEAEAKSYPVGSFVVKCAQPFRAHVLDMFEPQDHPNDFAYPGAAPTPPYDSAGWTLAFQMGVKFDRLLNGFDGPFEELKDKVSPGRPFHPPASATPTKGYYLDPRVNDSFRAVNRLLAAGETVCRVAEPSHRPAGSFYVTSRPTTASLLRSLSEEFGVLAAASPDEPTGTAKAVRRVRVGLWDRYGGSMPSGWTRLILERFEFPYHLVFVPELDRGHLREKFDVLIFPDGAIPPRSARPRSEGGDQPPPERDEPGDESDLPAEYRGRKGTFTLEKTVPQLRQFLDDGGTVLTVGSSTALAKQLGLPVENHLATKGDDGKEKPLPRERYYVPGSVLRMRVSDRHPLAWGLDEHVDVMFNNSPTFRAEDGQGNVAWFDTKEPLRSGWAWGQDHLETGVAVAECRVGKGKLVLYGPRILFRGQPHGTFKLLFNGIVNAGMEQPAAKQ